MENAACNVIYVDRAVSRDRYIRADANSADKETTTLENPHIAENVGLLLDVFGEGPLPGLILSCNRESTSLTLMCSPFVQHRRRLSDPVAKSPGHLDGGLKADTHPHRYPLSRKDTREIALEDALTPFTPGRGQREPRGGAVWSRIVAKNHIRVVPAQSIKNGFACTCRQLPATRLPASERQLQRRARRNRQREAPPQLAYESPDRKQTDVEEVFRSGCYRCHGQPDERQVHY